MKKTYLLSDLHLGAPYFPDSKTAEKRVVSFLDFISRDAETIYLLGDVLDYWYEYKHVVPKGFVRFFGKLAQLSDAGIKIVWLIGNHDIWIYDYLPTELGIEVIDGSIIREINGFKCFLSHGDGLGKLPLSFKILRSLFRNRFCQIMYSSIHPRWTIPFATGWSRKSRKKGEEKGAPEENLIKGLREFSKEYHASHPEIRYFIYGHVHVLCEEKIGENCEMIILGEWIHTFSYALFDESGIHLLKWGE